MSLHTGEVTVRPVPSWDFGVRARLLLAFFGITAFAVLAAAVGIYAFRQVGERLDVVNTRVPPTITSLELSRSAERIIAAAPALLAANDRKRRDAVKSQLEAEVGILKSKLLALQQDGTAVLPLGRIEPVVTSLTDNLASLEEVVARRLDTNDRIRSLVRGVFQTNEATQRLLAPWLMVMESQISGLVDAARRGGPSGDGDAAGRLASLVLTQRPAQNAERAFSSAVDMLAEASSTDQERRLPILSFQLGRAIRDLEATAAGMDPKLRPLFLEQVARLKDFVEGPNAIPAARRQELALVADGERRLAENAGLTAQLTLAVDDLSAVAKDDIGEATRDALSVQRFSTRVLIIAVALSLLTSILIAWLYVGRNILRRLTALSDGMLAIASGKLDVGSVPQGSDEIAAMGRAVEVFRRNAFALRELLEERERAAARLEETVAERTCELSTSLEQQMATAEVLNVISRSAFTLQPVLDAIVATAARLCEAEYALVFKLHDDGLYHMAAASNAGAAFVTHAAQHPIAPTHGSLIGRTAIEKRTVHILDCLADPEYAMADYQRIGGHRTMLGVPLLRDGAVIGAIGLLRNVVRSFSDKQVELVTTFADQAVIAIENVRLFEQLAAALDRQTATAEVLQVISRSTFDLQTVLSTLVESVVRLCEADIATITRQKGEMYFRTAIYGFSAEAAEVIRSAPVAPGRGNATARALLEAKVVHIPDVLDDPEYDWPEAQKLGGYRTLLGVPLLREGIPIGAMTLGRRAVRPFTDKEIDLVRTFADQAVIAIENVRLFEEVQERTRELQESLEYQTATGNVLGVISRSPTDLQPALQSIVEIAAGLCEGFDATILLRQGEHLRVGAHHGSIPLDFETKPISRDWITGRAVLDRKPVHVEDLATMQSEFPEGHELHLRHGHRTGLAIPLLQSGAAIGAFMIRRREICPFSEKQVAVLQTFADQAVIAINNVRLFEEVQARTRELAHSVKELKALGEVSQAVNSTLDLEKVLETIVTKAVELSGTEAGAIYVYSNRRQEFRLRATYGMAEDIIAAIRREAAHIAETVVGEAVKRREPLQVPDLRDLPGSPVHDIILKAGYRGLVIVPLLRPESVVGALIVRRKQPGLFPDRTVSLLMTFAEQSVLAIQNARLFAEIEEKGRELAEASRHKSQFLANMSHELRTPLNSVLGFTEMMVDGLYGDLPARATAALEKVQKNGRHLLGLINDVLDLSKIEAGQLALSLDDYSLAQLVKGVVATTESLANSKGLALRATIPPALPVGRGDERRLAQVIINLVGNAIKFTETGSVEIDARAAEGFFEIDVRDTGPGIAPEDQTRIFEEFQQVDDTSTRTKGGTGLGLAISRRIVEMHGGALTVRSAIGHGSTFTMRVPVRVAMEKEAA